MHREQLFEYWAPPGGLWSPWVKPVLFLDLSPAMTVPLPPIDEFKQIDTSFAPPPGDTAVVIDLPGDNSAALGVALAYKGYRPVPLYNCCGGRSAVIDVNPIVRVLAAGGEALDVLNLPWNAPPAFLLDANRADASKGRLSPGKLDNRWVTLPQDFPSANFLLSKGIRRALLVQDRTGQPRDDLAHVLRRWQDAGIEIAGAPLGQPTHAAQPLTIHKPSMFGAMFYTLIATIGLRRNSAGGFGSVIPQPSSGSGYG